MWIAIGMKLIYLIEAESLTPLKKYHILLYNFYPFPNAILIGKSYEKAIRLTTSCSNSIYTLIMTYKRRVQMESEQKKEMDFEGTLN